MIWTSEDSIPFSLRVNSLKFPDKLNIFNSTPGDDLRALRKGFLNNFTKFIFTFLKFPYAFHLQTSCPVIFSSLFKTKMSVKETSTNQQF